MTEADLCQILIKAANERGWSAYPETSGWDVLLVHGDGTQIGVQAKLHATMHLLAQTLPLSYPGYCRLTAKNRREQVGPDFRAILIPDKAISRNHSDISHVCMSLGLWVLTEKQHGWAILEPWEGLSPWQSDTYDWRPTSRCWLPEVVPGFQAGISSPIQMTEWKQKAFRFLARAQIRGYVTSVDAKELGLNIGTFVRRPPKYRWLELLDTKKRPFRYRLWQGASDGKRPDVRHPEEFAHFVAEQEQVLKDR